MDDMMEQESEILLKKESNSGAFFTNKRIIKSLIVLCVVTLLVHVSYGGLILLQSRLHSEEGLGVITTSVMYISMALYCLLFPKLASVYLGHRWCIILSVLGYVIWTFCNGSGLWLAMIPAAVIMGTSAASLRTSSSCYIIIIARIYAKRSTQNVEHISHKMFSVYNLCYLLGEYFSHLVWLLLIFILL